MGLSDIVVTKAHISMRVSAPRERRQVVMLYTKSRGYGGYGGYVCSSQVQPYLVLYMGSLLFSYSFFFAKPGPETIRLCVCVCVLCT